MNDIMSSVIYEKITYLIENNYFSNIDYSCIGTVASCLCRLSNLTPYLDKTLKDISLKSFIDIIEKNKYALIYIDLFTCAHTILLFYNINTYCILESYEKKYSARIINIDIRDIYTLEFGDYETSNKLYTFYFGQDKPCKFLTDQFAAIHIKLYCYDSEKNI